MTSVVKSWLKALTLKQQTVLLSAIRGPDGIAKEDVAKKFVRAFRSVVLEDACPDRPGFMADMPSGAERATFLKRPDTYPLHWLMHFMHAVEIVGYKHPDEMIRWTWRELYRDMCDMLHVGMEPAEVMDVRLADGVPTNCYKT